jgi:hypothetical protein
MSMEPAPPPAEGLSRDELYKNWLVWVTANMGDDADLSALAANAAADAAVKGGGFNGAVEAARKAWIDAAPIDKVLWRPGFWPLLLTSWTFWALLVASITAPFLYITALAVPFLGWKVYTGWRLSHRGMVVPGSLTNVQDPPLVQFGRGGGRAYVATYQFEWHEQQHSILKNYELKDSIRQDVLVLFDPKHPWLNVVMPEILDPGA